MNKDEFVARIADRLDVKAKDATAVVDATIAELFSPAIFGTPGGNVLHTDNDCNNNCREEMARITSIRG